MEEFSIYEVVKLAIYYGSYLCFPAIPISLWFFFKVGKFARIAIGVFLFVITIFAYARFVEPRILVVEEHVVEFERCGAEARIAVFSDTHIGLFDHAMPIERITAKVNEIDPHAVLIPGDFLYFLEEKQFEKTFEALASVKAPIFAVLGNHDNGMPGPDASLHLPPVLKAMGVIVVEDEVGTFSVDGDFFEVVGLSDAWAEKQKRELLHSESSVPRLVLTHNPRTILELSPKAKLDLMVAGHTHGGQINIPGVTCLIVPFACHVQRHGLAEKERGSVFVTSGTGMVGLPMRFNVPPKIDVLNIQQNRCGEKRASNKQRNSQ